MQAVAPQRLTVALVDGATAQLPVDAGPLRPGDSVMIGIRPEQLATASPSDSDSASGTLQPAAATALAATVQLVEHLGDVAYVHALSAAGTHLTSRVAQDTKHRAGGPVLLCFAAADALVFDAAGRALQSTANSAA